MIHIDELFRQVTDQLIRNSQESQAVNRDRVFQPANIANRILVDEIISRLVLPGSEIVGFEHLKELYERSQRGESCLLLMEHYSNFDIPCLFYLSKSYPQGEEVTGSVVAMAGTKLNEESRFVLAFTEAYTRIVIYPARLLRALEGTDRFAEEQARSRVINRTAMREMIRMKHEGHIILLFPAGTRYRPGNPESKSILLEVDSYIKGFDHIVFVGIAGNTLEVSPAGDMEKDTPKADAMVYLASPVTDARAFREAARATVPEGGEDAKRAVATAVGTRFDELHAEAEARRSEILAALAAKGIKPQRLEITPPV